MGSEKAEDAGVEAFIARWSASGGAERANYQLFLTELCTLLGLPQPDPARETNNHNDYVFERSVAFKHADGTQTSGFIDLYKRDCFVLEAKQSGKRDALRPKGEDQLALIPEDATQAKAGTAKRGTRSWDTSMLNARRQAEDYAKALPKEHGWPPFLVVVDVGHCIELYADFVRQGKNYAQFPDRRHYRIMLDDLRHEVVRERLRLAWTDPLALDPAKKSAEVTRDIAERLAKIARALEARKNDPGRVAEFLMRCLFTMFAEDVRLLPEGAFTKLIEQMKETPEKFRFALEDLWKAMNTGDYTGTINEVVKRFNGGLFAHPEAITLEPDEIHELYVAARRDWRDVEPAIFGTLLERALDKRDRHKLGAHYTPRAYVERLVVPTIIEPLSDDWKIVQAEAEQLMREGKPEEARAAVRGFHQTLCATRVLDPACGTGNFLYVSMELMKRLEGEVLDYLAALGEQQYVLEMSDHTVDPHQFLGLEINPRAVQIADLVLWIGFIKWQIRTGGQAAISEPVLRAFGNIREQDAVLAYDKRELLRDEHGKPVTRWDGVTTKKHPVTGEDVPDETARVELYTYSNPKPAVWPETDFIVGNPPFIGNKRMISALGEGYVEALRTAHESVPGSVDFVMYWWDQSAGLVGRKKVRRFGLITTNTFTQIQNRAVAAQHMARKTPLHIVFAVPDHPWVDAVDGAAVRISMTVGGSETLGRLLEISKEEWTDGEPGLTFRESIGQIRPTLSVGTDTDIATSLRANALLASMGPALGSRGFVVDGVLRARWSQECSRVHEVLRPLRNGRDLLYAPRGVFAIDLDDFDSEGAVVKWCSPIYQHLLEHVRPDRVVNRDIKLVQNWWKFRRSNEVYRNAVRGLTRYIATPETAKHRLFQFVTGDTLCEHGTIGFGWSDPEGLAMLSSKIHILWTLEVGGTLEDRPRYNKTRCFDPFPFPDPSDALKARLRDLGERLDAFRKERQAEHPDLTMTGMYNVLERLRELDADPKAAPLTDKERAIHEKGLVSVLKQLHDEIDAATFEAYGWPRDLGDEQILERLVALNKERAAEEKKGHVRWLRPDYQIPRFAKGAAKAEQVEADLEAPLAAEKAPAWPAKLPEQIKAVRDALAHAGAPVSPIDVSKAFKGGARRKEKVSELLESLAMLGQVQKTGERYFLADRG
ncbi:class I SAM-dependent DNA methyltransferase [Parvibaculum sp.]|uniref:class I SAM-dependent DNA methyltransferase n=1 Tax=Parvibaculum sp. TaxID=2024848 RepID=UPI002D1DC409|nr:type IIL restriction-modification enzyme MmeI [Parvibaculum sp.]HUD52406.1 type IIL restriction-modification enzyme MmeI [Parvibaculum sp.]